MVIVPSKMGRHNKRALLDRLLRLGTASRAELAKSLGLSQPTAGKLPTNCWNWGCLKKRTKKPGMVLNTRAWDGRADAAFDPVQIPFSRVYNWAWRNQSDSPAPFGNGRGSMADPAQHTRKRRKNGSGLRKAAAKFRRNRSGESWSASPVMVDERKGKVIYSPNLRWTAGTAFPSPSRKFGTCRSF